LTYMSSKYMYTTNILLWQEPEYMYIPIGKIFRIPSFLRS
jgi:hypothetical protein